MFDTEYKEVCKRCNTEYKEVCKQCNTEYKLFTQADDNPEYYTNVYILCTCGEKVVFSLPVN